LAVLWFVDLWKGYISPEGSASSLACYAPISELNIYTAARLWVSDEASANSNYGDLNQWDVAKVTNMSESKSIRINDVTWTHAIVIREFSRGIGLVVMMWYRDSGEVPLKHAGDWVYSHDPLWQCMCFVTNGDILIRCPDDISYVFWTLWDFLLALVSNTVVSQIVGGLGLMARRWCKGMRERMISGENGVGGWWWWGICWEGTRVVGCAWSLSVSSLPITVFGSEFFRFCFLASTVNELALPLLYLVWLLLDMLCVRFPHEIGCFVRLKRFHDIS
jgi:hypothetical protein